MSTRNLDPMFGPASVAVIGASPNPERLGALVWRAVRAGSFRGPVYAVNPHHRRLDGQGVYASVSALPQPPDLALVCTPAATVPGLIAELGARGTRAVVVYSAGLDAAQRQAMLDAARPHILRVLGPQALGLLTPRLGLNASLLPAGVEAGELAFVSQSNALAAAMLDWARAHGIGFSQVVTLGDSADVDTGDLLDLLASDPETRSILLYLETVHSPRKFMSAARAAARNKPVIVVRAGVAADPAADRVYGAAFARAGMLRVQTLQQMFLAAETLARFRANRSDALAVLCNSAGIGALATDAARRAGVPLAPLAPATLAALQPLLALPARPLTALVLDDQAPPALQMRALRLLQDDPARAALLLIHAPHPAVSSAQLARTLLPLATQPPPRLLSCWLGESAVADARRVCRDAEIAHYASPEEAVSAFGMLADYRRNQAQLMQAPPSRSPELPADAAATARALVQRLLASGRSRVDAADARALLGAYGIELVARLQVEAEPYAAASAAERVGYPVALRLLTAPRATPPAAAAAGTEAPGRDPALRERPDDDRGGTDAIRLDLRSAVQVRDAARRLLGAQRRLRPDAAALGFVVTRLQPLLHARALLVGTRIDPVFGPVILLGHGGESLATAATLAAALPPLDLPLARALVQRAGVDALLLAQGDAPAADEAALLRVLVGVSQLLIDLPALESLELAPLRVGPAGAVALRAQLQLSVTAPAGALNFAIRPYPSQLVQTRWWQGRQITLRPIRPQDEAQHLEFLGALAPEDIRMRVFHTRSRLERSELARLTQIDYARELALIAVEPDGAGGERTLGVVRTISSPDNQSAEFGIVIRSELKGLRLGELLLGRMIEVQRLQGTARLVGSVLAENTRMLDLARQLGFTETANPAGDGTRWVELAL